MRLFLAGDVMTGRGIDQALPRSVDPELREPWVRDARRYLRLAERASGPIGAPLDHRAPWGDALAVLADAAPDARIVNLETAVTADGAFWPDKGIHYRMHPANVASLRAARLDLCVLANNHVMDFGVDGLRDTLAALRDAGIRTVGAGADRAEADAPAVLDTPSGRLIVAAYGVADAGVPRAWRAEAGRPGVARLDRLDDAAVERVAGGVAAARSAGDRVVVSLHWGANWVEAVPDAHRRFARRLIEAGGADLVFGHSSHHPLGIEVIDGRAVLYGTGDLLNDYEGIGGHEELRPSLTVLHLPELAADGTLRALTMVPMRIRRLRLERASAGDARWLASRLDEACRPLGSGVELARNDTLRLAWR